MNVLIDIKDDNCLNMSDGAQEKLKELTEEYANTLLCEAALLEEADRQEGANSEITSSIIVKAASYKKYSRIAEKKTPIWLTITKIVSTITCITTGLLFDASGYTDKVCQLIFFLCSFAAACVSTSIMYIKER